MWAMWLRKILHFLDESSNFAGQWYQEDKSFWILMKQGTMWWQWHWLDQMQIICSPRQITRQFQHLGIHICHKPDALSQS